MVNCSFPIECLKLNAKCDKMLGLASHFISYSTHPIKSIIHEQSFSSETEMKKDHTMISIDNVFDCIF